MTIDMLDIIGTVSIKHINRTIDARHLVRRREMH